MSRAPHLACQSALVRMLYDPHFAAAVRLSPRTVLAHLPTELADELGRLDTRALRRDRHRQERTLGQLAVELPCSISLALAECGRMQVLLDFYRSSAFHECIDTGGSLVLALGSYLKVQLANGVLHSEHLAAVLQVELASANARRETSDDKPSPATLRRAPGVVPIEVPWGTLQTIQAVEAHRFRLALLPEWAQVVDAPPIENLPTLGTTPVFLAAVSINKEVSLVEIEHPLFAVLISLVGAREKNAVLEEATHRLHGDHIAASTALASLIEDELVLVEQSPTTS